VFPISRLYGSKIQVETKNRLLGEGIPIRRCVVINS
jgi:hypothetical protein